jgi:hypothetical protein
MNLSIVLAGSDQSPEKLIRATANNLGLSQKTVQTALTSGLSIKSLTDITNLARGPHAIEATAAVIAFAKLREAGLAIGLAETAIEDIMEGMSHDFSASFCIKLYCEYNGVGYHERLEQAIDDRIRKFQLFGGHGRSRRGLNKVQRFLHGNAPRTNFILDDNQDYSTILSELLS